jgi:hypothetical protein
MIRGRLRRLRGAEGHEEDQYIEIEPGELSRLFAAPGWLRDAGFTPGPGRSPQHRSMCEPIFAVPPGSLFRISLTGQRKAGHTAA